MKKLILALLFVLSLLAETQCNASTAKHKNYPKLECVHGNMTYTIVRGDTLSEIAHHYGQRMAVIANVQSNGIKNLNRIYAGRKLVIPCCHARARVTSCSKSAQHVHTTKTSASHHTSGPVAGKFIPLQSVVSASVVQVEQTSDVYASLPAPKALADLPLTTVQPFQAPPPDNITVADNVAPQPERTPNTSSKLSTKKIKTTGYQMVIPHDAAFTPTGESRIPLDYDLHVWLNLSDGRQIETIARAHETGRQKDVLLSVMLKDQELPKNLLLLVIDGVNVPLDGQTFQDNAKPFRGTFPGQPHKGLHVLFSTLKIGGGATAMSFALGPQIGIPVAGFAWATNAIINHHALSVERKDAAAAAAITATANARMATATARLKSLQGE